MKNGKKAILVVSFGTSHAGTRRKTIDAIEQTIQGAFPDQKVYRAWTSKMIIRKLLTQDEIVVDTVEQAVVRMKNDGITDMIVQPTHVMDGMENERMKEAIAPFADQFDIIRFGAPLLTGQTNFRKLVDGIMGEFSDTMDMSRDTALVWMGHGTSHEANAIYLRLDEEFHQRGYDNVFVGTMEGGVPIEGLKRRVKASGCRRVLLTPFLIVAGAHALRDMAGDGENSWKSQFEAEGLEVECLMKGLGEYDVIRRMFVDHVEMAVCR